MVNFRLSEAEYEDLRNLCIAQGARSLSDLARAAVCRLIENRNGSGETIEATVRKLNGRLEELDRELKRLVVIVERGAPSLGNSAEEPVK